MESWMPQCSNSMGQRLGQKLGQVLLGKSFTPIVSAESLDGIQFVSGLVSVVQDDLSHRTGILVKGLEDPLCVTPLLPHALLASPCGLLQWDAQPTWLR